MACLSTRFRSAQRRAKVTRLDKKTVAADGKPSFGVAWCRCGWDTPQDWLPDTIDKARKHLREHGQPDFLSDIDERLDERSR